MGKPKSAPVCRKPDCGAPIIWAITTAGARMALDKQRDASQTSKHAVMRGTDLQWYVRTLQPGEEPRPGIEHRHMVHYATCAARNTQPTLEEPDDHEQDQTVDH